MIAMLLIILVAAVFCGIVLVMDARAADSHYEALNKLQAARQLRRNANR